MTISTLKSLLESAVLLVFLLLPSNPSLAFAFIFAGESSGVDIVTHPIGYSGTGGTISVSVGIDPSSANAASMVVSVQNVITVFNNLVPTTGNILLGGDNEIPSGAVDFESTLLHELGHSLGLAHVNAASESGLSGSDRDYTKATDGSDNIFNLNPGSDGVNGSEDDLRSDDVNLHYFRISNNDPFTVASTVDQTTYSRDVASLPSGDLFATNADRSVSSLLGYGSTEAVMQQGAFFDEAQRTLTGDDVSGILYAAAGVDEIAGTADDYTLVLTYAGLTTAADIVIDFDNNETGFAVSSSSGAYIPGSDHVRITANNIYFNDGYTWFFNSVALPVEWAYVSVQKEGRDAVLHWATTAEVNHDRFEIERSFDKSVWEVVSTVYPTYTSPQGQSYQYRDESAANIANHLYYRIRQVDMDGKSAYSEVREVTFVATQSELVTMGPIPLRSHSFVEVFLTQMEQVQMSVLNLDGREVKVITRNGTPGTNRWVIGQQLLDLSPGTYILRVHGLTFQSQMRVIR